MLSNILLQLEPVLTAAIVTLITFALAKATQWLTGRIKSEAIDRMVLRAGDDISDLVRAQAQAIDKYRGPDGRLTEDAARLARGEVIGNFKALWGKEGLARLARILGLTDVDAWLAAKVDSQVRQDKVVLPLTANVAGGVSVSGIVETK
jgi:hypothetical protein